MWPAQELFNSQNEPTKTDWLAKWSRCGGKIFNGRMIALKNDAVWSKISLFGIPYPPFDEFGIMWVRDVPRRESEKLGLISSREELHALKRDWSEDIIKFGIPEPNYVPHYCGTAIIHKPVGWWCPECETWVKPGIVERIRTESFATLERLLK
jgi:hypothetical protein